MIYKCEICGQEVDTDQWDTIDARCTVCPDCAEHAEVCAGCGKCFSFLDDYTTYKGDHYCGGCAEELFHACLNCGAEIPKKYRLCHACEPQHEEDGQ